MRTGVNLSKIFEYLGGPLIIEMAFWRGGKTKPVLDMVFDDPEQESPQLFYPNNVRIALPWPNMWVLMYRMTNGRTGICTAGRMAADQPAIEKLEQQREEILSELPDMLDECMRILQGGGWDFDRSGEETPGYVSVACRQHDMVVLDQDDNPLLPALPQR